MPKDSQSTPFFSTSNSGLSLLLDLSTWFFFYVLLLCNDLICQQIFHFSALWMAFQSLYSVLSTVSLATNCIYSLCHCKYLPFLDAVQLSDTSINDNFGKRLFLPSSQLITYSTQFSENFINQDQNTDQDPNPTRNLFNKLGLGFKWGAKFYRI